MMKKLATGAVLALVLAFSFGCPLDLRSYVERLKVIDALGLIDEVTIQGGSFQMGDGAYGPFPIITMTITYSYLVSKYEITNVLFGKFISDGGYTTQSYWTIYGWTWRSMGGVTEPPNWTNSNFNDPQQPVSGVNWYEAVAFCNWRSVKEGLTQAYDSVGRIVPGATGYRLPTLLEWEYAAAKGAPGAAERIWAYGDAFPDSSRAVWMAGKPATVASKSPAGDTPQGLADMSGNIAEWCSDNSYMTPASTTDYYNFTDGAGATSMGIRGGSWASAGTGELQCAYTNGDMPGTGRMSAYGFRTVRRQ